VEFLDTNILVYAVSHRLADQAKRDRARSLLRFTAQAVSLQVLQEFYSVCRAPKKLNLSHAETIAYLKPWRRFFIFEPTAETFDAALALCEHHSLSFYDANILAAAAHADCDTLLSEDLGHNQRYGHVTVINPFLA
jgi:predicted nucleic acid-binding protein